MNMANVMNKNETSKYFVQKILLFIIYEHAYINEQEQSYNIM